jgi:hypothetical protein
MMSRFALAVFLQLFLRDGHVLQVQIEEKKLNSASHGTGSVFIDGVEFVKVSSP